MKAFIRVVHAELLRFSFLRTVIWAPLLVIAACAGPVLMFGLAIGDAIRYCTEHGCAMPPDPGVNVVLAGFAGTAGPALGVVAALLCGAMFVLPDFRHRVITTNVLINPQRWSTYSAKALLAFVFAAVGSGAGVWLGAVFYAATAETYGASVAPTSSLILGFVFRCALAGGLLGVIGVAVAFLLRRAILVVSALVLWPLLAEPLIPSLLGESALFVAQGLPVVNVNAWVGVLPSFDFRLTVGGALMVIAVWTVVVGGAALLRFNRLRLDSRVG